MRPEGVVAFSGMSAYLLLIVVFSALWLLWMWLGALFDAISDYHRQQAAADSKPRGLVSQRKER